MNNQIEFVNKLLEKVSYKPNTSFYLIEQPFGLTIELRMFYANSCSDNLEEIEISRSVDLKKLNLLWLGTNTKKWLYTIEKLIRELEDHEIKEWFKYSDKPIKDPHPAL